MSLDDALRRVVAEEVRTAFEAMLPRLRDIIQAQAQSPGGQREDALPILLTITEAAEVMRTTPPTIRKWIKEERLQGRGTARCVRVSTRELMGLRPGGQTAADDRVAKRKLDDLANEILRVHRGG